MSAIELRELTKRYAGQTRDAVHELSLTVGRGEVFGLLGVNGAGKTTTVRMCTTLARPTSGTAFIEGVNVVDSPLRARAKIGLIGQTASLDNDLPLGRGIYYHCRYMGLARKDAREQTVAVLDQLGLSDSAAKKPIELSGGLAQRAMIARAVAHRPRVLFVDEPTTGLDVHIRLAVWRLLQELRTSGTTILLTTHNLDEADTLCDRVAIMDAGELVACDEPGRLKALVQGETVLDVAVAAPLPLVEARLQSFRSCLDVVLLPDNRLRVHLEPGERVLADILEALVSFEIIDISVERPTLEAVFLKLTQGATVEPAPVPRAAR